MSTETAREPRRRLGGRSARVREAVLDAAYAELGETGYSGFSLESVARRSGVHKTTVYRRWPTRESLIADALDSRTDRDMPVIDTGSLRGDLRAFGEFVREKLTSQYGRAMVKALVQAVDESTEVLETVKGFWRDRLDAGAAVVARGVNRGELPSDTDSDLLIEGLLAPIYLRVLFSIPHEDEDFLVKHVELLLDGVSPGARSESHHNGDQNSQESAGGPRSSGAEGDSAEA